MGKASKGPYLPGFSALAPSIYIQDSKLRTRHNSFYSTKTKMSSASSTWSSSTRDASGSPDMIIITSWTGANPKHITKYTLGYNDLYPGVPIVVITTVIQDLAFRSTTEKMNALAPLVTYLCPGAHSSKPGTVRPAYTNILLHAFSEGGSNKAVCLARAFVATTGSRIPVGAFVFDSTPGTPRFSSNVAAFRRSLPRNPLVRILGLPFGFIVLAITWVLFCLFVGYENNAISKSRRALNDSRLWAVARVPRTYIFSEADDLIWWKDVEDHSDEAAKRYGVTSLVVRFKKSGHCNHLKNNEEYYWNAVRKTWEARDLELGGLW